VGEVLERSADGSWPLELRPFQLVTIRFRRA
jgi:hypothetical protein